MKIGSSILAIILLPIAATSAFSQRNNAQHELNTANTLPKNQFFYAVTGNESSELSYDPSAFPKNLPMQLIQGGNSRLTYKMPLGADRVQMLIQSNGRPLKARVELWCGPIRRTHFLDISNMNGQETPVRACLKFKAVDSAGPQTLQINTSEDSTFPAWVGVDVMTPERSAERQKVFDAIWKSSTKIYSQGDKTIRSVPIADNVKSVMLLVWSKDVGKKSFKVNVELLQGPNCKRQYYQLQCGGGSQPYQAVFETPGNGWTIRWTNTKTLHDGSHEFVLVPYEVEDDVAEDHVGLPPYYNGYSPDSTHGGNYGKSLGPHGTNL
mmetsp:Transcript_19497/g.40844  ORF Transcript_19497/g.40844 Transcript_19497/m.40844 type:complete len:323 (-) Transcript_19497:197-1165(-)|eukprot:CAMPEP_0171331764 /NCGR_PEP_ID=MMETSP0878-20121228/2908_1 /TAXON_ID=67004 /ORGANISM="Thalassiosira weissflogii, Strain CCMP1336" /LENGTH=322 /DNA_ID=CAMNT_0011832367 /DNA_START=149 /DNA_END=1117 /DNA_ORIENTATION=+